MSNNKTTTMLVVVVAAFAAVGALTALGTFVTTPGTFVLGSFATPAFASYGDSGGDSQHDFQGEESGNN
jgi:hypothetical protein